jgi:hypothetical protein
MNFCTFLIIVLFNNIVGETFKIARLVLKYNDSFSVTAEAMRR